MDGRVDERGREGERERESERKGRKEVGESAAVQMNCSCWTLFVQHFITSGGGGGGGGVTRKSCASSSSHPACLPPVSVVEFQCSSKHTF